MKNHTKFLKGKKALSLLLAMIMVVSVFSPSFSSFGITANALMTNSYPVELAFNNLFVFDEWANNELSTTVMMQGDGNLVTDIENGSFVLSKTNANAAEVFTAFSWDTQKAANNANYYAIDVKPNTEYRFSYTLENATYAIFTPYVFYFDKENLCLPGGDASGLPLMSSASATNLNGENSWNFITPANADHIQLRFTVTGEGTATGTVKDIIICEEELINKNIFDFDAWASNENSNGLAEGYNYAFGTHSIDTDNDTVTLNATNNLSTNFIIYDNCQGYYTMDVEPNTTYVVSYNLYNSTLVGAGVALSWHKADGSFIEFANLHAENSNGLNDHYVTTPYEAAYMQFAFCAFTGGAGQKG